MRIRGLGVALVAVVVWVLAGVSVAAGDSCPNAVFRTGPSASLPDCRAYEQVSPVFKDGGVVFDSLDGGAPALDGGHIFLDSIGGFGEPGDNSGGVGSDYVTGRAASGWASTPIDPPLSLVEPRIAGGTLDVSQDFSRSLFARVPRSAKAINEHFYIHEPDGSFVDVGPALPPGPVAAWTPVLPVPGVPVYRGASADLSHIFFLNHDATVEVNPYRWPGDESVQGDTLYEYAGTANSVPTLVGVNNAGSQISQCGTELGALIPASGRQASFNAVSSSGATVYFTAAEAGRNGCKGSGPLVAEVYARIAASHTVAISESSAVDCSLCDTTPADQEPAIFQGASRDGSKAFFLTSQPLLGGDSTQNLYMYDFNAPAGQGVVRVSAGDPAGANVQGVVGISEDGSHVYFVAQGVLTSVPNSLGQSAVAGAENLYVYQPDLARPGQDETVFLAGLSGSDEADWSLQDLGRPAEVTPDGRFLLFTSRAGITPNCAGCTGEQLYRYDSATGALVRVSIGQNGFNQNGTQMVLLSISAPFHGEALAAPQPVSISDDGAYVFFRSPTGLTPQAVNNVCLREEEEECVARAQNFYEYHAGQVYLISDGQDRNLVLGRGTVQLLGASPSGHDVFFETADPLVAQDTDTQVDVYDARIDGGLPAPAVVGCAGEGCQGALSAPSSEQFPSSLAFTGPGNAAPPQATATKKVVKKHATKKKTKKAKRHSKTKRRAGSRRVAGKGR